MPKAPQSLRALGLFFYMNRVSFLIDGFNIYHSVCDALKDGAITNGKWLNLHSLCSSYLYLCGKDAKVESIHYFSALATHIADPDTVSRHLSFISSIESTSVKVVLGQFKKKKIRCRTCNKGGIGYEEKESDVNIAVTLLELFMNDLCDTVVIITGDSDQNSVVRAAKRLFPAKRIICGFPYKRHSRELQALADSSFKIRAEAYAKHQFPNTVSDVKGNLITKPVSW